MKYTVVAAIVILACWSHVAAQQLEPKTSKEPEGQSKPGMSVQLMPYGYIELPRGYWAYMLSDWMDAWSGYIENFDGTSRIKFSAGLIQPPFEVFKKEIKWTKTLEIDGFGITYALVERDGSKRVIASIKSAYFDQVIKDESEIEGFLKIVEKYKGGRCESCFDSRWTKPMRKRLESRFGEQ